ncbi:MAG: site-2 protease family protein [Thermomicrobiales bacterium]
MALIDVLYFAFFWIVTIPLLTLLHECGHAIAALACTNQPVTVDLGNATSPGRTIAVRRLRIRLRPFSTIFGSVDASLEHTSSFQRAIIFAAGPFVSGAVAVILAYVAFVADGVPPALQSPVISGLYCAVAQTATTAIPIRYPRWLGSYGGVESDGLRIMKLFVPTSPQSPPSA